MRVNRHLKSLPVALGVAALVASGVWFVQGIRPSGPNTGRTPPRSGSSPVDSASRVGDAPDAPGASHRSAIRGTVTRWTTGAPGAGAVVTLTRKTGDEGWAANAVAVASTRADASGRFELDDLEVVEGLTVRAELDDAVSSPRPVELYPGMSSTVHLDLHVTSTIRGKVLLPDGRPAPRAQVCVRSQSLDHTFAPDWVVTCAADGSFEVPGVMGRTSVWATHADWARSTMESARIPDGAGLDGIELVLRPARRIGVRVVDEATGAPLSGARVMAFALGLRGRRLQARTGSDGWTVLERVPVTGGLVQMVDVTARLDGYLAPRSVTLREDRAGDERVVLELRKPITVTGVVVSAHGLNLEGAVVHATRLESTVEGERPESSETRSTTVREDGRFVLALDHAGTWRVGLADSTSTQDVAITNDTRIEVSGHDVFPIDVALKMVTSDRRDVAPPSAPMLVVRHAVGGKAYEAGRSPYRGADERVRCEPGRPMRIFASTDQFPVTITAKVGGLPVPVASDERVTESRAQAGRPVELRVDTAALGSIRLRVEDAEDAELPLTTYTVRLMTRIAERGVRYATRRKLRTRKGTGTCEYLPPGTYRVTVAADGYESQSLGEIEVSRGTVTDIGRIRLLQSRPR